MEKSVRNPLWDSSLPMEERLQYLLENMTLEEKFSFLSTRHPALERLGIPMFFFGGEAAHGIEARHDQGVVSKAEETTSFTQPIGMSASWDTELIERAGAVVGTQARVLFNRNGRGGLSRWAPTVDMERDPRWGRTEEAYGEDPLLTGRMASAYIRGLQGTDEKYLRMAASVKHFYANNVEEGRIWKSSSVDPRNKQEYYLEPFRRVVEEGRAEAMMTAYNEINGVPAILNHEVRDVVKGEWGLPGHVVCDGQDMTQTVEYHHYYETHAETVAEGLKAGIDCFTDNSEIVEAAVREAFARGLIAEEDIDDALRNSFGTRIRLGLFDGPEQNPYARLGEEDLNTQEDAQICREMAQESAVLLKNDNNFLPLDQKDEVAIVGPVGDAWFQDWYGGEPPYRITLKAGVESLLGRQVPFENGLDHIRLSCGGRYVGLDENARLVLVDAKEQAAVFEHNDWGFGSSTLYVPSLSRYVSLHDDGALAADKKAPFGWFVKESFSFLEAESGQGQSCSVRLRGWKGQAIGVKEEDERPVLAAGEQKDSALFQIEAVKSGADCACRLAQKVKKVIVALGCNPVINSKEEIDRTDLILPPAQEKLIQEIYRANPNVVLMLFTNYPYAVNWEQEHLPAILQMATGSQEMGSAAAALLFGEACPAGRLPMTWYKSVDDLPDMDDYDIIQGKRTYQYFDKEVLYPFGYGLSYTKFHYENLFIERDGNGLHIRLDVVNCGDVAGDEVVQLYVKRLSSSRITYPYKRLVGFERVKALSAGERRTVELEVPCSELAVYDVIGCRKIVEEGEYLFFAGASSADEAVIKKLWIAGEVPGARRPRKVQAADHYDAYENIVLCHAGKGETAATALSPARKGTLVYRDYEWSGRENGMRLLVRAKMGGSLVVGFSDGQNAPAFDGQDAAGKRAAVWQGRQEVFAEVCLTLEKAPNAGKGTLRLELDGDVEIAWFSFREKE